MKIKDVKCEVYLQEPSSAQRATAQRLGLPNPAEKVPLLVLSITANDGIEGFASAPRNITEQDVNVIRHVIIDKDPFEREWIWQKMWELYHYGSSGGTLSLYTMSAVDVALWDLAGKALGQPIYKLLGAYRNKIKVYASSIRLPSPQHYFDEVTSCKNQGITAYKLHVDPEIAIESCRAAREAGGDDMTLMYDPFHCYNRVEALQMGKELEELNYYWFEEPIPDVDIEGLIMLREKLNIPIAATENAQLSMFTIPEYLVRRACDIVRCDTLASGGITPTKKIADMCNAFGTQCELHQGVVPTGNVANLHVECAVKNSAFHEIFPWPDGVSLFGLKGSPKLDDEGYIHVLQKPGLGIEIAWEALGEPVESY